MEVTKNRKGKDYIIGDLHGCYDMLINKLVKVEFDKKKDRLFSVGDLIDRGPKSLECLSLVFEPWFFSVRGNHEQDMFNSMESERDFEIWSIGRDWAGKEKLSMAIKAQDKMPFWITMRSNNESIGIVHAEPPDSWNTIDSYPKNTLINGRGKKRKPIEGIDKVYVGHTGSPDSIPYEVGNTRYIDTTAFHTGILTMEELWINT